MSRILWTHSVTPPADAPVEDRVYEVYDPPLVVPGTRALAEPNRRLVELPDRRSYRSMSRAGVLLSAVGLPAREVLAPFSERDRYRVGIYCAADPGPQNYRAAKELLEVRDSFAQEFRRHNHPKLYFTQLANLPAAQLAIYLDLRGPVNVYKHSVAAALHAFEQAELDLAASVLDAALVCAAMSLEDPLLSLRVRRAAGPSPVVSEGAAALVLAAGGEERDWLAVAAEMVENSPGDVSYGIADLVFHIVRKEAS